ncbi:MAG: aminotransferase class I/II-fold pyridoxal phosphate-dependent enzyme [Corynebacteriales bacterium]|nr:aminotransferase class I/II-fold pyridoxal phosphate-dependent enzyme [Mycobacteriales bacterium]
MTAPLAGDLSALSKLIEATLAGLAEGSTQRSGPVPALHPNALNRTVPTQLFPENGADPAETVRELSSWLAAGAADPAHPSCAGHLHCPPLAIAVAADVAASALNQSLDSWDQAPSATTLETHVLAELAALVGFEPNAAGVITSGGTESNLTGLLLARDSAIATHLGAKASSSGVALAHGRLRIICSEAAHFSVQRAAALLGLGENAVLTVPVDADHRMDLARVAELLAELNTQQLIPAAIVATAGTTDFGAIDPLAELADLAERYGSWLHVDAAYGGGALFSPLLAPTLAGIERAHSVSLDLHKVGWQPIAAGIFLARDAELLSALERTVAYLNPIDDEEAGYPSLLGRSIRTTRRADVFKIAVTLRALGRTGLASLVESCHGLVQYAATHISAHEQLELAAPASLASVVFRYRGNDELNGALRRHLLETGAAVIGRTAFNNQVWLKLTLLNPYATTDDIDGLIKAICTAGLELSRARA